MERPAERAKKDQLEMERGGAQTEGNDLRRWRVGRYILRSMQKEVLPLWPLRPFGAVLSPQLYAPAQTRSITPMGRALQMLMRSSPGRQTHEIGVSIKY